MKIKKIIKYSLIVILSVFIITSIGILIFVSNAISEVRALETNLNVKAVQVAQIYDIDNKMINESYRNNQKNTKLSNVNEYTIDAFTSIEDKAFFDHNGISIPRIIKSLLVNIKSGQIKQGASTITQQLVKNKYLTQNKSIKRKIQEIYLAIKLEKENTKEEIMEAYLNTIYYGSGAYGIGDASYVYFGKVPKELTINESALLAGVINSPYTYSPIYNYENSLDRKNLVLKMMLENNKLSQEEYSKYKNENVEIDAQAIDKIKSLDLYSRFALSEASEILGKTPEEILNSNYKIFTYQDKFAQDVLDNKIYDDNFYEKNSFGNIADSLGVIINAKTKGVTAISGRSNYNLVNIKRQPGSIIKPNLIYTPAYEKGIVYPCSKILDDKIEINGYAPQNVSNKYYGNISIRDAVAKSLNIPAVKLCNEIGIENCKSFASHCGLEFSDEDNGLAIALGGLHKGLTIKEIAASYIPYLNQGLYQFNGFVRKIISPRNVVVYGGYATQNTYCSPETSYLMTETLQYAANYGTSKRLKNIPFDIAGKTGTVGIKNSNDNSDVYSLAYTSEDIVCVWMGNYSMDRKYNLCSTNNGGTYVTDMIKDIMLGLYDTHYPEDFKQPENVIKLDIDTYVLENSNKVVLANNTPEKYVESEIFSTHHYPIEKSKEFVNIDNINLKCNIINNSYCRIQFDTKDTFTYSLFRIIDNRKELIKTFHSDSKSVDYLDNNIPINKEFQYLIKVENFNKTETKEFISHALVCHKDYSSIIKNYNTNESWIFQ